MREIVESVQQDRQIPAEPLVGLLERVITTFLHVPEPWVALAHVVSPEPILIIHPVNVTILALVIGQGMGYAPPRLRELALRAYLHDLGMIKIPQILDKPRQLSRKEREQVNQHPLVSAELIERLIPGVGKGVCYSILQEHERLSGAGYPEKLAGGEIEEEMRIIGLIDVYEALTHPRPWRERLTPHQAIEYLLSPEVKAQFDPGVVRLLVTHIGIYPIGTWVTLSTGESGRVLRVNPPSPLRPVVEVLTDTQGEPLGMSRRVDLSQHPALFIKEFVKYDTK